MAFTIDDAMLPARAMSRPMTDEEFAELSRFTAPIASRNCEPVSNRWKVKAL
jgi:hypothetical protein